MFIHKYILCYVSYYKKEYNLYTLFFMYYMYTLIVLNDFTAVNVYRTFPSLIITKNKAKNSR